MSELPPENTPIDEENNLEAELPEDEPINVVPAGPPPVFDTDEMDSVDWEEAPPDDNFDEIGAEEEREGGFPVALVAIAGVVTLLFLGGVVVAAVLLLGGKQEGDRITLTTEAPSTAIGDNLALELSQGEAVQLDVQVQPISNPAIADAVSMVPQGLNAVSPIYTVSPQGGSVNVKLFGVEPALVDVYYWDSGSQQWLFAPSSQTGTAKVIEVGDGTVVEFGFFQRNPQQQEALVIATEGGGNPSVAYNTAIAEAAFIDSSGVVQTRETPVDVSAGYTLVENRAGGFGAYSDPAQRQALISQLAPLLDAAPNGLVLNFPPGDGYVDFVAELQAAATERGKRVEILMPAAEYDAFPVTALGTTADRIWVALPDDPNAYVDGRAEILVAKLVGDVERSKAGIIVNGLNVDIDGNGAGKPVSLDKVAEVFGDIQSPAGYLSEDNIVPSSVDLPVRLNGQLESLGYDTVLNQEYLTYRDEFGGLHTVYFASPAALANQLALARSYNLNAAAVYGLAHPDAAPNAAEGLAAFVNSQAPPAGVATANINWRVESENGSEVASTSGDLNAIQYLWDTVEQQGDYTIRALFGISSEQVEVASLGVTVGDAVAQPEEEEPEEVAQVTPEPQPEEEGDAEEPPVDEPTPAPPPANAGTIAAGIFELGGQTQNLANPDAMRRAGMNWVKFQHKWSPGDDAAGALSSRIAAAQGQGFKVLFSIPGQLNPQTTVNYAAYVDFLAQAAALGPDAIEVWNEQNITREWPPGQISGTTYTNEMLIPAYAAIKAANPNVLVIAGAPAPTGFFGGCTPDGCDDWLYVQEMANAGAGNHMDCMGVHYNEGIISPTLREGDPRDGFYSRYFFGMVDTYSVIGKPLCFTELGYLTSDGFGSLPPAFGWAGDTSVQEQAQWLAEAAVLSSQSGIVRMMIVFNVDFTLYGDDPQAGYAMLRPDGSCPACDALGAVQP